jgi:hypothetical protein
MNLFDQARLKRQQVNLVQLMRRSCRELNTIRCYLRTSSVTELVQTESENIPKQVSPVADLDEPPRKKHKLSKKERRDKERELIKSGTDEQKAE